MNLKKRKSLSNTVSGVIAFSGVVFAISNSIFGSFSLFSNVSTDQLLNSVLAAVSGLWLYLVFSSVYHENALSDVAGQVAKLGKSEISQGKLEELVLARIDEKLRPMFGQHLRSVIDEITSAYETKTVTFSNPHEFKSYYLAVLRAFPIGSTLTATSIATEKYFWDGNIEEKMAEFVQKRGKSGIKFRRVFYLLEETFNNLHLLSKEQIVVLKRQLNAGIDVYIYPCSQYPKEFVLADGDETVAWVVEINDDFSIRRVTATSNKSDVKSYAEKLKNIFEIAKPITIEILNNVNKTCP